jgi:hypothetical protein
MFTIPTSDEQGNASPAMNTALSGSKTILRHVPAKRAESIRDTDVELNDIDENELQDKNMMNKEFRYFGRL